MQRILEADRTSSDTDLSQSILERPLGAVTIARHREHGGVHTRAL